MSSVNLLHLSVDMSQIFLLILKVFLRLLHNEGNQPRGDRQDHKRDQRHERRDTEHHDKYTDQCRNRGNDRGNALVESLS